MKKYNNIGFTLLELIIVIVIIGVLATLGLNKYQNTVEKSRGAEAKAIIGDIRKAAYVYWLKYGTLTPPAPAHAFIETDAGIGGTEIPGPALENCKPSHYFYYKISNVQPNNLQIIANRCTGTWGKRPGVLAAARIQLNTNFDAGTDAWTGSMGNPYL